jgi:hypothetical protein
MVHGEEVLSSEQITESKSLATHVVQENRFGLLSEPRYVKISKSARFSSLPDLLRLETNIFKTNLSENEQRSEITGGKLHYVTNRGTKCGVGLEQWFSTFFHLRTTWQPISIYRGADKSLARPGRKQATATKF